jgi:hypothetical protein
MRNVIRGICRNAYNFPDIGMRALEDVPMLFAWQRTD